MRVSGQELHLETHVLVRTGSSEPGDGAAEARV